MPAPQGAPKADLEETGHPSPRSSSCGNSPSKAKAERNLEASDLLLRAGLVDAAMSRLYYALFQAGIHGLRSLGRSPQDFGPYERWRHATACGNARLLRTVEFPDIERVFRYARQLREQANYSDLPVTRAKAEELAGVLRSFVE